MKKHFITGLIVLVPLALTVMLIVYLFNFFTTPLEPIVKALMLWIERHFFLQIPENVHIILARIGSLILLTILVLILGIITRVILVQNLINSIQRFLSRIPFIKIIFHLSQDFFSVLLSRTGKKMFQRSVMVPFPQPPNYCMGFEVSHIPEECQSQVSKPLVAVFMPTAPHPISGFILFVEKNEVRPVTMTTEDTMKFLVSCGMIIPQHHE